MDGFLAWIVFFASAGVVVAAGTQLARYGDRVAEETGIGGLWIGVVLIATATSLPEIVTAGTAAWIDEADLAAGGLFGSSMSNMMILALLDLLHRRRRVWQSLSRGHALVAGMAIVLTSLAGAFALADVGWSIGHVGPGTVLIGVLYVLGMRVIYRQQYLLARERLAGSAGEQRQSGEGGEVRLQLPSRRTVTGFGLSAAFVLGAAPFVTSSASDISEMIGISGSFAGATFLAITTSLPELATGVAAVRLGSYDLAVGNLFGSNAFNIFALLFVDMAYRPGPVAASLAEASMLAAFTAVLLTALGMMGVIFRAERRLLFLEPDAAALTVAYLGGMWLVYQVGG